jgi:gallate dioxygenase
MMRPPARTVFTGENSRKSYRLMRFFIAMKSPAARAAFKADPEAQMAAAGLSEEESGLVRRRDYQGMLDYGASIYAIAKGGEALGTDLVKMGSQMRGETPEAFLARRPFRKAMGLPR